MGADDKKMMTDPFVEGFGKVYKGIVAVGVLCVLVVFPLYFRYYYFDILEAKYQFYYMVMIGMFAVCLLTAIAFLAVDFLEQLAVQGIRPHISGIGPPGQKNLRRFVGLLHSRLACSR